MSLLTPMPPVPVRFAGARAAEGPLTFGQLNILRWVGQYAEPPPTAQLTWTLELPDGVGVEDVAAAFAVLLARHEGLRTTYADGEDPVQRVAASGELLLGRYAVGEDRAGSPNGRAVVTELSLRLRAQPFGFLTQLPVQVALATRSDLVVAGVVGYSHIAVDQQALEVTGRELARMLRDPRTRQVGASRHQPLDQAALERQPRLRRRSEAALRAWEQQLRRMPKTLYASPRNDPAGRSEAAELSSPAAAMALRHVAARTGRTRSTIVLAALCALLSRRLGYRECTFPVMSGNRADRQLVGYVGTLAQVGLVTVDAGGAGFDQLVQRVWAAVLQANRRATYDVDRQVRIRERIETERGVDLALEPLFNSVVFEHRPAAGAPGVEPQAEVAAATARTTLRWRRLPPLPIPLRFDLWPAEEGVKLSLWSGDTARVGRGEVEALLLAVERLLVAAAAGDLDQEQLCTVIDLEPIPRGPDWLLVDACWIELPEVQRLLDDALAPAVARVFPAADDQPLVAYVAADAAVSSPAQAHARCMAALPGRPTAMTPRWYVLCDAAPDEPADLAGWKRQQVLDTGSGRPPQ